MDRQYPIFTADTECQDCYKCVRHCPVKAIKIENARAAVMPELCVACGRCVNICPAGAKRVRDDVRVVEQLLAGERPVYLSLAPSYVGEFADMDPDELPAVFAQLGFAGVSETALGADAVSTLYHQVLLHTGPGLLISTACPVAVEFIQKYLPEFAENLAAVPSPMMMHGQMLRKRYGEDIAVVFAGPCIAKKRESDHFPATIDAALTFRELKQMMRARDVEWTRTCDEAACGFVPHRAGRGALYPVNGGMIDVLHEKQLPKVDMVTVTGIDSIRNTLRGVQTDRLERPVFLELLACEGGCIGGPGMSGCDAGLVKEMAVRRRGRQTGGDGLSKLVLADACVINEMPVCRVEHNEDDVRDALRRVGKDHDGDELNCGGCGYETCRGFAAALLDGRAEPAMCLSYLRKQAQKKANALLRSMPSGVVIVDADLQVVECNENFATLFGDDTLQSFQVRPGLEGARIEKILPFADVFCRVLETNVEFRHDMMRVGERLLNVTVFTIEPNQTVGAILQDVTDTEGRRESIATRAGEVIEKNLATVQDIACLLGEHMADTELLLRSIASDYSGAPEMERRTLPASAGPPGAETSKAGNFES